MRGVGPSNSISWNIGHLAWQEQRYWLISMQGLDPPVPRLVTDFRFGGPPSTPGLAEVREMWETVIVAADPYLDTLTTADLEREVPGRNSVFQPGSLMHRTIYHYWFHLGEAMGIRQALGHTDLPQFVGNIDDEAPFRRWEA